MEPISPVPGSDIRPQASTTQATQDHERRDASIGGILWFGIILAISTVIVHIVLAAWMISFELVEQRVVAERPELFDDMTGQYAGPRLQDDPARDMETFIRAEWNRLETYGWVEHGKVARIPINRAIDLLLERGLPKVPTPASTLPGPRVPTQTDQAESSGDTS